MSALLNAIRNPLAINSMSPSAALGTHAGNIGLGGMSGASHLLGQVGGMLDAPGAATRNFLQGISEFAGGNLFGMEPKVRPGDPWAPGFDNDFSYENRRPGPGFGDTVSIGSNQARVDQEQPAPWMERMLPGVGGILAGLAAMPLGLPAAVAIGSLAAGAGQFMGGPEAPDAGVVGNMLLDPTNIGGALSGLKAGGMIREALPAAIGREAVDAVPQSRVSSAILNAIGPETGSVSDDAYDALRGLNQRVDFGINHGMDYPMGFPAPQMQMPGPPMPPRPLPFEATIGYKPDVLARMPSIQQVVESGRLDPAADSLRRYLSDPESMLDVDRRLKSYRNIGPRL